MSNSFQFDYDIFYNYYTNDDNLETDTTEKYTNYYPKTYSKIPKKEKLSDKFIWINNKKVHITKFIENGKNALLFSLPPKENTSERWDDHFHFGIDHNIEIKDPLILEQLNKTNQHILGLLEKNKKDKKKIFNKTRKSRK